MMEPITRSQLVTQGRYYRLPKALFEVDEYKSMTTESKVLYSVLQDRLELSIKNNWFDENDSAYLKYSNSNLMELLGWGEKKIIKLKKELATADLIKEVRMGRNQSNRIYVGQIVIHKTERSDDAELSKQQFQNSQNDSTGTVKTAVPVLSFQQPSDTNSNEPYSSDTELTLLADVDLNNLKQTHTHDSDAKQMTQHIFDLLAKNGIDANEASLKNRLYSAYTKFLKTDDYTRVLELSLAAMKRTVASTTVQKSFVGYFLTILDQLLQRFEIKTYEQAMMFLSGTDRVVATTITPTERVVIPTNVDILGTDWSQFR